MSKKGAFSFRAATSGKSGGCISLKHDMRDAEYMEKMRNSPLLSERVIVEDIDSSRTSLNEVWELHPGKPIEEYLSEARQRYTAATGQKPQAKTMFLRAAIMNVKSSTTLQEMQEAAEIIERETGMTMIFCAIHKDEGHYETSSSGKRYWKGNYHAHAYFLSQHLEDWKESYTYIDKKSGEERCVEQVVKAGRTCRNMPYSKLQTLLAPVFGMERGEIKNDEPTAFLNPKVKFASERTHKAAQLIKMEAKQREAEEQYFEELKQSFATSYQPLLDSIEEQYKDAEAAYKAACKDYGAVSHEAYESYRTLHVLWEDYEKMKDAAFAASCSKALVLVFVGIVTWINPMVAGLAGFFGLLAADTAKRIAKEEQVDLIKTINGLKEDTARCKQEKKDLETEKSFLKEDCQELLARKAELEKLIKENRKKLDPEMEGAALCLTDLYEAITKESVKAEELKTKNTEELARYLNNHEAADVEERRLGLAQQMEGYVPEITKIAPDLPFGCYSSKAVSKLEQALSTKEIVKVYLASRPTMDYEMLYKKLRASSDSDKEDAEKYRALISSPEMLQKALTSAREENVKRYYEYAIGALLNIRSLSAQTVESNAGVAFVNFSNDLKALIRPDGEVFSTTDTSVTTLSQCRAFHNQISWNKAGNIHDLPRPSEQLSKNQTAEPSQRKL